MKRKDHPTHIAAGSPPAAGPSRGYLAYLIATAVVCGALVMVIEVLGSRVIGPFFGASLFVWTSLITVTLVALAAGYAVGGVLADRRGSPAWLYGIILAAGVLTLLIPLVKGPVLRATMAWGLRGGALASSFLLFGPALFLLGCVSPYLVRLAAREMQNIGRTVGVLYALSTAGSFIGTVVTGFLLIAWFGVTTIFQVVGAALIALAAGYFLLFRKSGLALTALLLPLVLVPGEAPVAKVLANGTTLTERFRKDTFYGRLRVVDYAYGPERHRDLMIDSLVQGGIDLNSRLPIYPYLSFVEFLAWGTNPGGKTCLVMGLGAGIIPRWFEERGVRTDVVDIDPAVVATATEYFGFRVTGEAIVADGRYFLNTTDRRYDYIVLDVFSGESTPAHLLSIEALALVRSRLAERGVLAVNLIGSLGEDRFITASIVRTLERVFGTVVIYPNFDPAIGNGRGNITLIAHEQGLPAFDRSLVAGFPVHPLVRPELERNLGRTYRLPEGERAVILTDDYNPADLYDAGLKEWVREMIWKHIDRDILI
jgi:MFS family permease